MTTFKRGDRVTKKSGSSWHGVIVGEYSTSLTPVGFCVESEREPGSVQLYPATALEHALPLAITQHVAVEWLTKCCECGRIIDKRERADGGDQFGAELSNNKDWTCSWDCYEAALKRLGIAE